MRRELGVVLPALVCAWLLGSGADAAAQAQARRVSVYVNLPVAILAPPGSGAIARVDLSGQSARLVPVVRGLTLPAFLACGPDQRLYVVSAGIRVGQITRHDQDGGDATLVAAFPWDDPSQAPTPILLAANGDMYYGIPGNWGLRRLERADPGRVPQQLIRPTAFHFNARPHAFIPAGPYTGDLLLIDNPFNGRPDPRTRVLRAKAPDYRQVMEFLTGADFHGLAVTSHGEIYVTAYAQSEVRRYASDGRLIARIRLPQGPNQIAIDSTGTVWVQTGGPSFEGGPPFRFRGGLYRIPPGGQPERMLDDEAGVFGVAVCEQDGTR